MTMYAKNLHMAIINLHKALGSNRPRHIVDDSDLKGPFE